MLTKESTLEEIREYFKKDKYATETTGCTIVDAHADYAVCELEVTPAVLNANNVVMGGAIFTLADFALAVAANATGMPSVGLESSIRYFRPGAGKKLIATCTAAKSGRSVGFYSVIVKDENDKLIADFTGTAFRTPAK